MSSWTTNKGKNVYHPRMHNSIETEPTDTERAIRALQLGAQELQDHHTWSLCAAALEGDKMAERQCLAVIDFATRVTGGS
jgi:hypothetical protein